jgi:hypothetical protein
MLVGAGVRLAGGPFRSYGAALPASTERATWQKGMRNQQLSDGFNQAAGRPWGYRNGGAWLLPSKAGALSSFLKLQGVGDFSQATGNRAKNASATLSGSGGITALGQLIVNASATLSGSGTISAANANALAIASATLTGSGGLTAALGGLGNLGATLAGVGLLSGATPAATGNLSATLTVQTQAEVFTPEQIAQAVWAELASSHTDLSTLGGQARFQYLLAHHKTVTDPVSGTFKIYDVDGTTVLFEADIFEDVAGTAPYDATSEGIDRRDRFV